MLSRYHIVRGRRPASDPLPSGIRQDTRKHTKHCLRPSEDMVDAFLGDATAGAWGRFASAYLRLLQERFVADRTPFDRVAEQATKSNVYLGCNCPTKRQPNLRHCHTWVALQFMRRKYPKLQVVFPKVPQRPASKA